MGTCSSRLLQILNATIACLICISLCVSHIVESPICTLMSVLLKAVRMGPGQMLALHMKLHNFKSGRRASVAT